MRHVDAGAVLKLAVILADDNYEMTGNAARENLGGQWCLALTGGTGPDVELSQCTDANPWTIWWDDRQARFKVLSMVRPRRNATLLCRPFASLFAHLILASDLAAAAAAATAWLHRRPSSASTEPTTRRSFTSLSPVALTRVFSSPPRPGPARRLAHHKPDDRVLSPTLCPG